MGSRRAVAAARVLLLPLPLPPPARRSQMLGAMRRTAASVAFARRPRLRDCVLAYAHPAVSPSAVVRPRSPAAPAAAQPKAPPPAATEAQAYASFFADGLWIFDALGVPVPARRARGVPARDALAGNRRARDEGAVQAAAGRRGPHGRGGAAAVVAAAGGGRACACACARARARRVRVRVWHPARGGVCQRVRQCVALWGVCVRVGAGAGRSLGGGGVRT